MGEIAEFPNMQVDRIKAGFRNAADAEPVMDARHLVRGWLSEGALSVLYGPSNMGKTFVAVSLAAHVATGKPWWGCKVRQAPVCYIALEGGSGFVNRVAAVKRHVPELSETRSLTYLNLAVDLYDEQGFQQFCEALPDEDWGLIVIDTLARAMCGADENAARDMGQFVRNMDRLREITGAHVMLVHHSGKDTSAGARGSSALKAAVDSELALSALGTLSATKQRDMAISEPLYFDLESISFGPDAEGEEVTSAVAVVAGAPTRQGKPLSGQAEVAMQALTDAIKDHGQKRHVSEYPSSRPCVHLDWKEMCQRKGLTDPGATTNAQRKAFSRAKDKLMDGDHIRIQDDYVWKVAKDD